MREISGYCQFIKIESKMSLLNEFTIEKLISFSDYALSKILPIN
jgi:hypothetical protein